MSLNMSTHNPAAASGKAFTTLPVSPAPAPAAAHAASTAKGSAISAAQTAAQAAARASATRADARKADGARAATAAARPAGAAAARATEAQPAARPQAVDTRDGTPADSRAAATAGRSDARADARNAMRPLEPAALPAFAQLLDLSAMQADEPHDSGAEHEAQGAADSVDTPESLAAMLPSFAVLPLSTNNGAAQDDGSGQGNAQDDGAAAIAGQQGALGSAAFALSAGASNAAALQAAQAAAAANAAAAQAGIAADSARQAAANAIMAGAAARNAADTMTAQPNAASPATGAPGAAPAVSDGAVPAPSSGAALAGRSDGLAAALNGDALSPAAGKSAKAGAESTPGALAGDAPVFRNLMASGASAQNNDTIKLAGSPEQWQQPLRSALGDRLQLQLQRNNEHAVIRLEPPNMGSIEISIRHSAGALQVNLSASHSDVLRQLNNIGDTMRQDLSQRQFTEVAVTVSASAGRSLADNAGGGARQDREQQERGPGRALNEGDDSPTTFAMNERE